MQSTLVRRGARIFGLALAALAIAVPGASAHKRHGHHGQQKDAKLQLLAINDFHGNLEPPSGSSGRVPVAGGTVDAGGVEYLATHVRALEHGVRNSLTVAAGDLIGASPLTSALFHDEPTIEAMNEIGLDMTSVGNHEFDEGEQELKRMQNGGCGPENSCPNGEFGGAEFPFLAANVVRKETGKPLFAPYAIRKIDGVKVGFIGMTLEGTPLIVSPAGISNLSFLDEADTANRYARELRRKHGVKAIVVLLHEGGAQNPLVDINQCTGFSGPIVDIVNRTTHKVDLFVTGHTHQPYNCVIDGRPVTSAYSFGRVVTDIDLTLNRRSRDVSSVAVNNEIVTRDVPKASDLTSLVTKYKQLAAPIAGTIVGRISADIIREPQPAVGKNPLGNLIADAQLADTDDADRGDADIALMNPGGVRADLVFEPDGVVTYEEAFTVQPFNNIVTTQSFTGAQILDVLKDQWCGAGQTAATVLLPSSTLTYTYDLSAAEAIIGADCANAANPVSNVAINGVALDPAATYRVTTNNFLADGGDGFSTLQAGTNRTSLSDFDVDSLVRYLEPTIAGAPIGPPSTDRITIVP